MKRQVFQLTVAVLLAAACAGTAVAWSINFISYPEFDHPKSVKFQIVNDSVENMLAFGVGVGPGHEVTNSFSPWGVEGIGDWFRHSHVLHRGAWDDAGVDSPWITTWQEQFLGFDWDDLFPGFDYAFVTTGASSLGAGGSIPAGITYGDLSTDPLQTSVDFGYILGDGSPTPVSPVAVRFDQSGIFTGETNSHMPNPAPIPEPGTVLLLGVGLLVMAGLGRRKFSGKV